MGSAVDFAQSMAGGIHVKILPKETQMSVARYFGVELADEHNGNICIHSECQAGRPPMLSVLTFFYQDPILGTK